MNLSIVALVFGKELRELTRDRRSLAVMFGVPLVVYPLTLALAGGLGMNRAKELAERPVAGDAVTLTEVAVVNPAAAPRLVEILRGEGSGVSVVWSADPDKDLAEGRVEAILRIPAGEEAALMDGTGEPIAVAVDRSRMNASAAERRIERALSRYESWVVERRLARRGVDKHVLDPVERTVTDTASGAQRMGMLLSIVLPLLLLFTGMLGAFFPALTATTSEREQGTFETLLLSPVRKMELLVGKAAFVLVCALVTSGLNLLSMTLVLWKLATDVALARHTEALSLSAPELALAYLAAVPTLVAFAAMSIIVGLIARNYREGSLLATPVMLLPLASMGISLTDPKASPALLVTPILNTTIIIRDVLTGRGHVGPFVLAFVSSGVFAGLLLSVAARLFSSEKLVNASWEPLTMRGLGLGRGGLSRAPRRLPAIDQGVALVSVSSLLAFYLVSPLMAKWGLVAAAAFTELGFVLAPTLLFAALAHWRWKETFSLTWPRLPALVAGLCVGLGLIAWVDLLYSLQSAVWRPPAEFLRMSTELFAAPLERHPIALPLVISISAGVCEELLYRGPLQTGLARKLPRGAAVVVAALFFAAAHMDPYGFAVRALIGVALGWLVVETRSIVPSMVAHAAYDGAKLLAAGAAAKTEGAARMVEKATETHGVEWEPTSLAACTALLVVGILLLRVGRASPRAATT